MGDVDFAFAMFYITTCMDFVKDEILQDKFIL